MAVICFGYATTTGWYDARWLARTGWHRENEKSKNGQITGFFHWHFSLNDQWSSRTYDLQFHGIIDFSLQHPSMLPVINRHLSHPLSAGISLASMLGCPLLSSFPLPVLLFSCRSIEPVPRWHQGSFMEVCFASTSHSYSPHPLAHAHARPRSSPDWMALCQPATVIVLICSSSLRCPSPCVYIWIPLSSPYSIHSLFSIISPLCIKYIYIYLYTQHYMYKFWFLLCMLQIVCLCFFI